MALADKMADGRFERDSALTRNKSRILVESLTNLVESKSERFTLDESISVIREMFLKQIYPVVIAKFLKVLRMD